MDMGPKKTAQQIALSYLRTLLQSSQLHEGDRLPKAKELANDAGVSINSMVAALSTLANEGVLSVRRGRGIVIGADEQEVTAKKCGIKRTAQRLTDQLRSDILANAFENDTLPSSKQLSNQFGVSYTTLRKAIKQLLVDGIIVPYRRTYQIVHYAGCERGGSIVIVVGKGFFDRQPGLQAFRWHSETIQTLEKECAKRRIKFHLYEFDNRIAHLTRWLHKIPLLLGTILWEPFYLGASLGSVCEMLTALQTRVAVFDPGGRISKIHCIPVHTPAAIFTTAIHKAGRNLARYLFSRQHRSVAYFGPYHYEQWSQDRLASIVKEYNRCESGTVHAFCKDDTLVGRKLYLPRLYPSTETNDSEYHVYEKLISEIEMLLAAYEIVTPPGNLLKNTINTAIEQTILRRILEPMFETALKDPSITCWIGGDDKVALLAADYLKARSIEIPKQISVVGFNDSPEALGANITSYNFDISGCMVRILNWLLIAKRGKNLSVFEIDGYLSTRSSG